MARDSANSSRSFAGELRFDCPEGLIDLLGPQPSYGANNFTSHTVGRYQLPSRRMAQVHRQFAQLQPAVGTGGQIGRFHGCLGGES